MTKQTDPGIIESTNLKDGRVRYNVRLPDGTVLVVSRRLIVPEPAKELPAGTRLLVEHNGLSVIGALMADRNAPTSTGSSPGRSPSTATGDLPRARRRGRSTQRKPHVGMGRGRGAKRYRVARPSDLGASAPWDGNPRDAISEYRRQGDVPSPPSARDPWGAAAGGRRTPCPTWRMRSRRRRSIWSRRRWILSIRCLARPPPPGRIWRWIVPSPARRWGRSSETAAP